MGILNVTPDSFFDGGRYFHQGKDVSKALGQAELMVNAGATFIDIGGESTRPGAAAVSVQEEMDRVLPVLEAISERFQCVISVDTSSAEVMRAAACAGAGLINDIRALQKEGALDAARSTKLPICLMHMQGQPEDMQRSPAYRDAVVDVRSFLERRVINCVDAGIGQNQLLIDPGFGFGKTDHHNLQLLKNLSAIQIKDIPVLVGVSRKSMLGRLIGRSIEDRLAGSLALAQYALQYGARILRVHDVAPTMDIVKMFVIMNQEIE